VLPATDSSFGAVIAQAFRAHSLPPPKAVVTSSYPLRNMLLASGRYLTMVPRVALTFPAGTPALKALRVDLSSTVRPLAVLTLKNRTLGPAAELFIKCTRELAAFQRI
jgi:DNA-binding transcriptional LysR family regulator